MPDIYRDADNGLQYVTTKGGNKVVIGEDNEGRVYFVDGAGNFYYDTGNSQLGFYVVSCHSSSQKNGGKSNLRSTLESIGQKEIFQVCTWSRCRLVQCRPSS